MSKQINDNEKNSRGKHQYRFGEQGQVQIIIVLRDKIDKRQQTQHKPCYIVD
jgi:hypothetical protein